MGKQRVNFKSHDFFLVNTNLVTFDFSLIFSRFTESPGISFASWMLYSVPPMLLMAFLIWLWLQIMYMGLFRQNSADAKAIDIGDQGEKVAATVIEKKYKELGPITWHESVVGFLFVSVVLFWFFRSPGFMTGWPAYITDL